MRLQRRSRGPSRREAARHRTRTGTKIDEPAFYILTSYFLVWCTILDMSDACVSSNLELDLGYISSNGYL